MSILETYSKQFLDQYNNFPQSRYISILLVRQIESEAIFRTEGSGEPLNKEFVYAGSNDDTVVQRVVISKRKQTAVERRTGRDLLRQFGMLHKPDKQSKAAKAAKVAEEICALNRNNPCERCLDCMIYGYAAGGGGAQRSRVVTDDAFSLHAARIVTDTKQFNALFDNSTMRDPESKEASTSIGTDEYVRPETIFLDIETLRDLTADEFVYVMGNILRSSRYGAISSRIGKVNNVVAGIIFSDCEIFSNLELTQRVYDMLRGDNEEPDFPLRVTAVVDCVRRVADGMKSSIPGRLTVLPMGEVEALVSEIRSIYQDEDTLRERLKRADGMYG